MSFPLEEAAAWGKRQESPAAFTRERLQRGARGKDGPSQGLGLQ